MTGQSPTDGLFGREAERARLQGLLHQAHSGHSAVLVVRGEPGIGKTTLLKWLAASSSGFTLVQVRGLQEETDLAFGALHQLCAPFLARLPSLPEPQSSALATAFGLREGPAPDRFLVGLGLLGLLTGAADAAPVLCVVDDAQWLDSVSAQTIGFAARRLGVARIALVIGLGDSPSTAGWNELPTMQISGLRLHDARALLNRSAPGRMEDVVRERILAEARGNPRALVELPRDVMAASVPLWTHDEASVSPRLADDLVHRVELLDDDTRRLLLLAAAEPVGDLALLRRTADQLGLAFDQSLARAEHEDLITSRPMLRFRHPLIRSSIYTAASVQARRDVHRALADATDAHTDPDRRSWHYASAATGPDEEVAASLEATAPRARMRGGVASAAAFLARAAELTPQGAQRTSRALTAAESLSLAGDYVRALEVLDLLRLVPLDPRQRAQADLVRGRTMTTLRGGSGAIPLLLDAAQALGSLDPTAASEAHRDALFASLIVGQVDGVGAASRIAAAIRKAPSPAEASNAHRLLHSLASAIETGLEARLGQLQHDVQDVRHCSDESASLTRWLPIASLAAHDVWDFETWTLFSAQLVEAAADSGALSMLPMALLLRLWNRVYAGDLGTARALAEQATSLGEVTGSEFIAHYGALVVAPWLGDEDAVHAAIKGLTGNRHLAARGPVMTATAWSAAVVNNALGRYQDAFDAALLGARHPAEMGFATWSILELAEAASKTGRVAQVIDLVRLFDHHAMTAHTDWSLATRAFVTAMTADDAAAEDDYREALEIVSRTPVGMLNARIHLSYGEWLLSRGRRRDARHWLNVAHSLLRDAGATGFAARASRGLAAAGVVKDDARSKSHAPLTSQELQIAHLAAEGLTNPEIGAQLFISAHTVEWHLRKVYAKLGIHSRRSIAHALEGASTLRSEPTR